MVFWEGMSFYLTLPLTSLGFYLNLCSVPFEKPKRCHQLFDFFFSLGLNGLNFDFQSS